MSGKNFGVAGAIERSKLQTFSLSYFKVGDGWKSEDGFIKKPIYVYKIVVKTTLSPGCNPKAIPPKKVIQGFCLRQELEDFRTHAVLPRGRSIFLATTPAMEKRAKGNALKACDRHNHPPMFRKRDPAFFCKNPYDMLKSGKARVCFWEYERSLGHTLRTLGGKLIAR